MLALQEERFKNGEKHLSQFDMCKLITSLKQEEEYKWLNEVSNTSLQLECRDLNHAYQNFFKKISKKPTFKKKNKAKNAYPVSSSKERFWIDANQQMHIQKVGTVKYTTDFELPTLHSEKFQNVRITFTGDERWIVSFGLEEEVLTPPLSSDSMGIDLGIKETATVSFGDQTLTFHNINKSKQIRELDKKIKHTQRSFSRKLESNKQGNKIVYTENMKREKKKLQALYKRRTDIINNYNHQMTHKLVSLLPSHIVMEDLNVSGMMKNRHLAKAIANQKFFAIRQMMTYKAARLSIPIYFADRFYPSSKTCSVCGSIHKNLKLSDRTFICPECGASLDRDLNAAINLARYKV